MLAGGDEQVRRARVVELDLAAAWMMCGMGIIGRAEALAHVGLSGRAEYLGGFRAGGWGGSWPLMRLTLTDDSLTMSPTWSWVAVLGAPRFDIPWADVLRVEILVGPTGAQHGLRFVLRGRLRRGRRWGHTYRPIYVRRPIFGLLLKDVDRALSALPADIPTRRARGFIIWP
jgi:hypothetical protein